MDEREQRQRAMVGIVVVAITAACIAAVVIAVWPTKSAIPLGPLQHRYPDALPGHAFDPSLGGGGSSVPVKPGDVAEFGLVDLSNLTTGPVQVLDVAPIWASDPRLVVRARVTRDGPGVQGTTIISAPTRATSSSTLLASTDPIPPSGGPHRGPMLVIDIAAPSTGNALLLGVDVYYELGGHRWYQRYPFVVSVCPWPGHHTDTFYGSCGRFRGLDPFRMDFDDLLKAVRATD